MINHFYVIEFDGLSDHTERLGNPRGLYDLAVVDHSFAIQPLNYPLTLELCYCGVMTKWTKIAVFNDASSKAAIVAPTICFKRSSCCYRFRDGTGAVVPVLGTVRFKFTETYGM